MVNFLHLHCHSDRTVGRSLIKPSQLVELYLQRGGKAACLTDNGTMSSAIQLYNACKKHGLKPIIGLEVNVAQDRKVKSQLTHSMVLLAKNITGFYNLVKLTTIGAMYFYYVPRVDLETIAQHNDGLIALTSDLRGIGANAFFTGNYRGIEEAHKQYTDIFGSDLYWELQPTQVESQRIYNNALLEIAQYGGFNIVASGDPHYIDAQDKDLHKTAMRARNSRNAGWEYPFKGDYHVLDENELVRLFSLLHGSPMLSNESFCKAFEAPHSVTDLVEVYDLRQQTRVPNYIES